MGKVKRQGFRQEANARTSSSMLAGARDRHRQSRRRDFYGQPGRNVSAWLVSTSSTFILFERPALTDLVTIIPFAAGSTFERTGPISKGGVFQPVRGAVTRPPGIPRRVQGISVFQATAAPVGTSPVIA